MNHDANIVLFNIVYVNIEIVFVTTNIVTTDFVTTDFVTTDIVATDLIATGRRRDVPSHIELPCWIAEPPRRRQDAILLVRQQLANESDARSSRGTTTFDELRYVAIRIVTFFYCLFLLLFAS